MGPTKDDHTNTAPNEKYEVNANASKLYYDNKPKFNCIKERLTLI